MKTEVFDLQDMNEEMDRDDQELMKMFPRTRNCVLDDMVLVCRGDKRYLEYKSDRAIRTKRLRAFIQAAISLGCPLFLMITIYTATIGSGSPWGWWAVSIACCLLRLSNVPAEIKN